MTSVSHVWHPLNYVHSLFSLVCTWENIITLVFVDMRTFDFDVRLPMIVSLVLMLCYSDAGLDEK